jgi:hypothetical protein
VKDSRDREGCGTNPTIATKAGTNPMIASRSD